MASVLLDENTGLVQSSAVTLPQVVIHSRDSNLKEFEKVFEMRKLVLETALATDKELRSLAVAYESLSQEMEAATEICRETPCGGASWKLNLEELKTIQPEQSRRKLVMSTFRWMEWTLPVVSCKRHPRIFSRQHIPHKLE